MATKPWDVLSVEFATGAVRRAQYPQPPLPQIAFAGRSNVGKSSLLNMLVRRRNMARTSSTPGHTQQINFFLVNERWHFVDLPGYGYARAPLAEKEKWKRMIEEYLITNPELRLLVLLLDARRKPSELDDQLVDFLFLHDIPVLLVMTKCDKLKSGALKKAREDIARHYGLPEGELPLSTSSARLRGRDELMQILHAFLEASTDE